ncbi:hypothetical protein ACWEWX_55085, partial [Streptomyces asiaticus]
RLPAHQLADLLRMLRREGYVEQIADGAYVGGIKRAEIAGELARRLGVAGADTATLGDEELEELAKARTTAAVTDWLTARLAPATSAPPETPATTAPADEPEPVAEQMARQVADPEPVAVSGVAPKRMRLVPVPLGALDEGAPAPPALTGRRFALLGGDGDGVAEAVAARLGERGAEAVVLPAGHQLTEDDGRVDGVLLFDPLAASGAPVLPEAFMVLQSALRRAPRWLLALSRTDPLAARTAGLRGVFRTVAREYPDTVVRLVEFPAEATGLADAAGSADVAGFARAVADGLLDELLAPDRTPVVLRTAEGRRHRLEHPAQPCRARGERVGAA